MYSWAPSSKGLTPGASGQWQKFSASRRREARALHQGWREPSGERQTTCRSMSAFARHMRVTNRSASCGLDSPGASRSERIPEMRLLQSSFWLAALFGAIGSARAAGGALLELETSIPMPSVKGRIDHFAVDTKRNRLLVAALGNDTVEIIDLKRNRHE